MSPITGRVGRGPVTLVKKSPLTGGLKSFVDSKLSYLKGKPEHKKVYEVYLRLKRTGRIRVHALKARLMSSPRFLAASILDMHRGADMQVLARKGSWVKVNYRQRVGWVHKNRIFPKVIRLSSGGTGTGTSRGEAELSGRG